MPAKITNVKWTARNLPNGISFDEQTGTFSGIPAEAGDFEVPVIVETNYGTSKEEIVTMSFEEKVLILKDLSYLIRLDYQYNGQSGYTEEFDLHDYFEMIGIPAFISLEDEGVTEVIYGFGKDLKQNLLLMPGSNYQYARIYYDIETGKISFVRTNKTSKTQSTVSFYLRIKTNKNDVILRLTVRTLPEKDIEAPEIYFDEWPSDWQDKIGEF